VFPAWYPQGVSSSSEERRRIIQVLLHGRNSRPPLSAVSFRLLKVYLQEWILSESRFQFWMLKRHCFEKSENVISCLFLYELKDSESIFHS
jgi:hypothetical protein